MKIAAAIALLGLLVAPSMQQTCDPASCVLPNCRCAMDPEAPGNLTASEIPQMVIITFENSMNTDTAELYKSFFNVVNPNGCPIKGTFFVEDQDSSYGKIRELFDAKHEIGVNSLNGELPVTSQDWNNMIKSVLSKLDSVGIDGKSVFGVRGPQLKIGSDEEFIGLGDNGLLYDSTCTSVALSNDSLIWPFTYDFAGPQCDNGKPPTSKFPGKWEFYLPALSWKGIPCATPAACLDVATKKDAFDLFYNNFLFHYNGTRTPFTIVINPSWAKNDNFREGTQEFIMYLRAAISDVWIVTAHQALQWIQDPTPIANIDSFAPWKCQKLITGNNNNNNSSHV